MLVHAKQAHEKWSLKVWCLACLILKYVWNFEIYYGKENPVMFENAQVDSIVALMQPLFDSLRQLVPQSLAPTRALHGQTRLAHNVIIKML